MVYCMSMKRPSIETNEPEYRITDIFRLENPDAADIETVFGSQEKSDAILDAFIAFKRRRNGNTAYGLYEYAPLEQNAVTELTQGNESLRILIAEAERREFCLKASLSPLSPIFAQTIVEHENEFRTHQIITTSPHTEKRVFAVSLRMDHIKTTLENDTGFKQELCARLTISPTVSGEMCIDAARNAIRERVFSFAKQHTGFAMSTSNWHITGALYNDSASIITSLKLSIHAWAELLYGANIPVPELLAQDILCAFAPYENQQSRYALLGTAQNGEWIVAQQMATNNLINQTNNALNYQAIADAIKAMPSSSGPATVTPLVIVHRIDQDGTVPEGFVAVTNPKKRSIFIVRPIGTERTDKDPDPVYPKSWNAELSTSQMRNLQQYRLDSFVSPKKLEQYLLDAHENSMPRTMSLTDAIVLDAEMDGSASMPDITGYSLMSQILAQDCNIDASEIFLPLIRNLTDIGIAMGAWIDEYAGDSIRLIFTDPANQSPNPSEKNVLFSIAAWRAQQQFDDAMTNLVKEQSLADATAPFVNAWSKQDLSAMRTAVTAFPNENKNLKLAQAFLYGREYIRATYGKDKYGMKTVSAKSACEFHYQGIGGATVADASVSHGKEILHAPEFDKERAQLETIAHEPGQWLVCNSSIYTRIELPWLKQLCTKSGNAYSIDVGKALADPRVAAYFASIGKYDLFKE